MPVLLNKKKITVLLIIPLLFCILAMIYVPYQTKINCYNDGMDKKCLVEQNTFMNRSFLKEWERKITTIEFVSKTIKDEKMTSFPYHHPTTVKSTRIAISRNQIILYGLGDASYRIMYDDFYLVAKPYHELLKNIKNFNENKIPLFTYEFTNVVGFVYCGFLLLIYYLVVLFFATQKRQNC